MTIAQIICNKHDAPAHSICDCITKIRELSSEHHRLTGTIGVAKHALAVQYTMDAPEDLVIQSLEHDSGSA